MAPLAQVRESQLVIFTSIAELRVPEGRISEVLKLLNRINGRMALGCFYLHEDGSLQFTTSVDALDEKGEIMEEELLFALMRRSAYYNLQIFDLYLPHVKAVKEGMNVEEAYERALEDLKGLAGQ